MTDPDEAIRKGARAQQILDDPVVKEALKELSDQALAAFKSAKPTDTEALQGARLQWGAIEALVQQLTHKADNGRFEKRVKESRAKPSGPPVYRV